MIWDVAGKRIGKSFQLAMAKEFIFTPDSRAIIYGRGNDVAIRDITTGAEKIRTLNGNEIEVGHLASSRKSRGVRWQFRVRSLTRIGAHICASSGAISCCARGGDHVAFLGARADAAIRFYTDHVHRVFARHDSWTAAQYANTKDEVPRLEGVCPNGRYEPYIAIRASSWLLRRALANARWAARLRDERDLMEQLMAGVACRLTAENEDRAASRHFVRAAKAIVRRLSVAAGVHPSSPTYGSVNQFRFGTIRPALICVPPRVWHGLRNLTDEEATVLNVVDAAYAYEDPDHWRLPPETNEIPFRF